jgi:hypothetical protein
VGQRWHGGQFGHGGKVESAQVCEDARVAANRAGAGAEAVGAMDLMGKMDVMGESGMRVRWRLASASSQLREQGADVGELFECPNLFDDRIDFRR